MHTHTRHHVHARPNTLIVETCTQTRLHTRMHTRTHLRAASTHITHKHTHITTIRSKGHSKRHTRTSSCIHTHNVHMHALKINAVCSLPRDHTRAHTHTYTYTHARARIHTQTKQCTGIHYINALGPLVACVNPRNCVLGDV